MSPTCSQLSHVKEHKKKRTCDETDNKLRLLEGIRDAFLEGPLEEHGRLGLYLRASKEKWQLSKDHNADEVGALNPDGNDKQLQHV